MTSRRPRRVPRKSYALAPQFIPGVDDLSPESEEEVNGGAGEDASQPRRRVLAIEELVSDSDEFAPSDNERREALQGSNSVEPIAMDMGFGEEDPDGFLSDEDLNSPTLRSNITSKASGSSGRKKPLNKAFKPTATAISSLKITQLKPGNRAITAPNGKISERPSRLYTPLESTARRLTRKPVPFGITPSANTRHPVGHVGIRLSKALSFNVLSGPRWETIEDWGWHKECGMDKEGVITRPVVHESVRVPKTAIKILSYEDAALYLPSDTQLKEDGTVNPPPPVRCAFGPFPNQTEEEIPIFHHVPMHKYIPHSNAHVFNAGGPVWGLDWCPVSGDPLRKRNFKQYLAVTTLPTADYTIPIHSKLSSSSPSSIQIWCYGPNLGHGVGDDDPEGQHAIVQCEMVVCIESGPAHEIKWCPLPTHGKSRSKDDLPKLGILAGVFNDGSLSVYAIPDPAHLRANQKDVEEGKPIFVHLSPLIRARPENVLHTCFDWGTSKLLAAGCSDGSIMVYDIGDALTNINQYPILPLCSIVVHQSAVRDVAWIKVPPSNSDGSVDPKGDPTMISSVAYDGTLSAIDTRDPQGFTLFRGRALAYTVAYGPYCGGIAAGEPANVIKLYPFQPNVLGHGVVSLEAEGPIWSVSLSDHHSYAAAASADGSCLTTNVFKPRKRTAGGTPIITHRLYRMDYERNTGKFRMLDNFHPEEFSVSEGRATNNYKAKKKPGVPVAPDGMNAWPPQAAVHRVAWQSGSGMSQSPLLASGTASGLCRIEWLKGGFWLDRVPYGSLEAMRMEGMEEEDSWLEENEDEIIIDGMARIVRKRGMREKMGKGKGKAKETEGDGMEEDAEELEGESSRPKPKVKPTPKGKRKSAKGAPTEGVKDADTAMEEDEGGAGSPAGDGNSAEMEVDG